ncbi:MAG TPA: hypothetical protein VK817_12135 [Trebonia sp.]|jgi:hypothetical protein|nr:hypothetical protein [Trebonia sp.]
MPVPVAVIPPGIATACVACSGAAFFQARAEWPRGGTGVSRHASACADHVVEAIQLLRAWGHDCELADGWLTVLAIDPHALGRTGGKGEQPGLPFYSAPLVTPGATD